MSTRITSIYLNNNIESTKEKIKEKLKNFTEKMKLNGYKVKFEVMHNLYTVLLTNDKEVYSILIFLRDFNDRTLLDIFIEDSKNLKNKNNKKLYKNIEGDIRSWSQ